MEGLDVPVTDTRQQEVAVVNNTDTFVQSANLNDSMAMWTDDADDGNPSEWRIIGCSKFTVSDINGSAGTTPERRSPFASTLTSPKLNSVCGAAAGDVRQRAHVDRSVHSANGIISQFGMDGKLSKLQRSCGGF